MQTSSFTTRISRPGVRPLVLVAAALGLFAAGVSTQAPRFYDDDPISREPESQDASKAQPSPIQQLYEQVDGLFFVAGEFSQFTGKKLDLITDAGISVDQYNVLTVDPAAAALGAVAAFAQKLFGAHVDIAALSVKDEFLKTDFLFVLGRGHRM